MSGAARVVTGEKRNECSHTVLIGLLNSTGEGVVDVRKIGAVTVSVCNDATAPELVQKSEGFIVESKSD